MAHSAGFPAVNGAGSRPQVQRQRTLPLSKAVEISYKNIRMRLSRSLLVTSGIVLALAFLMSILATDAITDGMRRWIVTAPQTPRFTQLAAERQALEGRLEEIAQPIR